MELKPGYKETEAGVIPEDWIAIQLGNLFEVTSSKRVFQSEWKSYGVPFYRARELAVLGETGRVDNELFITREMYESFKRSYGVPEAGDMLVTGVGTLGKVYVVVPDHDFYFKDGNIIWFKIAGSVCSEFLRQLYLTPVIKKQIGDGSAGTTVGTYTISGAKDTTIPFPPLPEQRAIATALSDADSLLDGLDRLIAKTRDLKQAAMQQLLTGETRLPGFEGEWEAKRLGNMGVFLKGSGVRKNEVQSGDLPCIRYGEIYTHHNDYVLSYNSWISPAVASTAVRLKKGDILFAGSGETKEEIGKCVAFIDDCEAYAGGDIVILRPHEADPIFMGYYCNTTPVRKQKASRGQGDAVVHISAAALSSVEVHVPSLPEQTAIATVLSDMDAEIAALEQRRAKTKDIKQAMMQELLTGKTRLL
jgi:type I restriction enzyme S subunit